MKQYYKIFIFFIAGLISYKSGVKNDADFFIYVVFIALDQKVVTEMTLK